MSINAANSAAVSQLNDEFSSDGADGYQKVSLLQSNATTHEEDALLDINQDRTGSTDADPIRKHSQPQRVPRLDLWTTQFAIFLAFSSAGILGGLYGVAGPPLMLFMMKYGDNFDLDTWRGTSAVMRLFFAGLALHFCRLWGKSV